jgi:hypothetical protein
MSLYHLYPHLHPRSAQLIALDISRTFPKLCMFQSDGPYFTPLQGLLGAYVFFRPDIGYVSVSVCGRKG